MIPLATILKVTVPQSLPDTGMFNFGSKRTKVDLEPTTQKPMLPHMSDAGVVCYAKWFGFTRGIIPEENVTQELREVVSYAYYAMLEQEDKERKVKEDILAKVKKEHEQDTLWQCLLSLKMGFTGNFMDSRLKPNMNDCNFDKRTQRQLRDGLKAKGLPINQNTLIEDIFRIILTKVKSQEVKIIPNKSEQSS